MMSNFRGGLKLPQKIGHLKQESDFRGGWGSKIVKNRRTSLMDVRNFNAIHKLFSMTQLLFHTFAHLTGPSFRVKAKLLPNKSFLGLV